MTGHPALLAPPPPLADMPQEASNLTPAVDHAEIDQDNAEVSLQAGLSNTEDTQDAEATTLSLSAAEQTAAADGTEATAKPKLKDFHTQVSDLTFGPNHDKSGGFDFKAYEQALVNQNLLPVFAISDSAREPLKLALNTGQDRTQTSLNHYRDNYFALKAQA
jgi:hypothetical protein